MDFPDGYAQIDTDGEGGEASEESGQNHQAAKELSLGGPPQRQSEARDKLRGIMKSAKDLVASVADHNGAKRQTHDEQSERLQTIEVAQRFLRRKQ